MSGRTYSRDDWHRAQQAWASFTGHRWEQARRICSAWTIWPPSEQGQDWRDAPHPSQRVIVWFALDNRFAETLDMIRRATSWSGVIDRIIASEGRIRSGINWADEDAELERRYLREQYRGAMQSLGEILTRWRDSA